MKTYKLKYLPQANKEWNKLDNSIRVQFKAKLAKVIENPHILKNKLSGMENCYKIKLRDSGFRLVYQVDDEIITVFVVAVGKRDKLDVYSKAEERV